MGNLIFDMFKKADEISKTKKVAKFFEEEISLQPFDTLAQIDIEIQNGNLSIETNKENKIELKVQYLAVEKIQKNDVLKIRNESNKIKILSEEKILERNIFLSIPKDLIDIEFVIYTANGSVRLDKINALSTKVVSKNGTLKLTNVSIENLGCDIRNGEVLIKKSYTGQTKVLADIGDIKYTECKLKKDQLIEIISNNGNISFLNSQYNADSMELIINANSDNGYIRNGMKKGKSKQPDNCIIKLYSKNGDIKII